jgi:hypothetical protein
VGGGGATAVEGGAIEGDGAFALAIDLFFSISAFIAFDTSSSVEPKISGRFLAKFKTFAATSS